jgi:hypothetical protein
MVRGVIWDEEQRRVVESYQPFGEKKTYIFSLQERKSDRKRRKFPDQLKNYRLLKNDSFTLKTFTVSSSKTLTSIYQTIRRHISG